MQAREWQFDGLVGPTHNYAGLAMGNLAAAQNAGAPSNPRLAALQGLQKMRFVRNLGVPQAFLPPHYRPRLSELTRLGFTGDVATILSTAAKEAPGLLASVYSSSFMWAANAATVTPATDTHNNCLHLTPANLVSHYHRSIETEFSKKLLQNIFHNDKLFSIHNALPSTDEFGDEGAANHMRICSENNSIGTHIFVYGKSHEKTIKSLLMPARQKLLASESVSRLHGIKREHCLYLKQSPAAIDQGVFHNDVIAMNTTNLMIVHAEAFVPEHQEELRKMAATRPGFLYREIRSQELSVADAVATYLFNSQLLALEGGRYALVAPAECAQHAGARAVIERLVEEGVLHEVHYLDVRESMRNGGGPACLRLRIVLNPEQEEAMHPGVILTDETYDLLEQWVTTHYRDRLTFDDLRDPQLVEELNRAYLALEPIVGMAGLYPDARGTGARARDAAATAGQNNRL